MGDQLVASNGDNTMTTAVNLATNTELSFGQEVPPLLAVCYGYCEERHLLSGLFKAVHDGNLIEFSKHLPVSVGVDTVACGDWAALTKEIAP